VSLPPRFLILLLLFILQLVHSTAITLLQFIVYVLLLLSMYKSTQEWQIRDAKAEIHAHATELRSYVRISEELHTAPHTSMH
jgi:hypothetical protein